MKSLTYLLLLVSTSLFAQKEINTEQISEKNAIQSFKEFYEMLSIVNDAHFPADIEKNIQWCESAFAKRGLTTARLETPTVPLLLAERKAKKAKKTVLIYLQIDGQPVNPAQWNQESPWIPTLKEKDSARCMEDHSV
jgi:acetylornithine deacetylase/succinyl-diaminopimelate desuccinylase-like protein